MKLFKRLALIALALLLTVGITAYVAVRAAFPPEKIAELVRTHGSELLGRPVEVGSVGVGVFPRLKVGVRSVSLANGSGFSAEPALSLKRLDLSVSWLSLLRFSPVIHEIRLVEPDILYEVDAAGRNNLEGLGGADTAATAEAADTANPETSLPKLPAGLALRAFVIDNGRVRYRDAQAGSEITLGRIDQRASLSVDPDLADVRTAGTLTISEISVRDGASGLRKGGVKISVTHDVRADLPGDSLRIRAVDIAFQDVRAHVEGSLRGFLGDAPPVADVHMTAPSISLASLLKEIPAGLSPEIHKLTAAGTASLDVRIAGALDSNALKAVRADITVREGAFGHADVPQGVEDFTLDLKIRGDSLRLQELSFRSGPNPLRIEALLTEVLNPVPYLRSLRVDGELDFGNLVALAGRLGLLDAELEVSGRQTLRLKASGPLDPVNPQRLTANGRIEWIGVQARIPELPPVRFHGIATLDNDKIRQQAEAVIGKSDVTLNAEVFNYLALLLPEQAGTRRTRINVDVRSALLDLDELLPNTGADAPPDTSPPLAAYPAWPPVDAEITVRLARTRLMNLDMTDFSLQVALWEKAAVTDLKGQLYTGSFSSSLSVTPKDSTDWGIGFRLDVDRVEANDFISRLNDRVPLKNSLLKSLAGTDSAVFGKFNLNLDLKTRGLPAAYADSLSGPIRFSVRDGRIVGVAWTQSLSASLAKAHSSLGFEQLEFSELKGDLLAEKGKLIVRDLSFDSPSAGSGRATGTIGFDNALDLQLTQGLPPSASKLAAGAGGALLGQLEKLVPGAGLSGASLFPTDKDGRALLYYTVDGTVQSPRFALDVKRMATEGSGNAVKSAVKSSLEAAARQQQEALKARAQQEKAKAEAAAKARFEVEKKRLQELQEKAAAEKKKLEEKAAAEAKKQGKKLLEGFGK